MAKLFPYRCKPTEKFKTADSYLEYKTCIYLFTDSSQIEKIQYSHCSTPQRFIGECLNLAIDCVGDCLIFGRHYVTKKINKRWNTSTKN